ncbi:VOC family protein [Streptomyces chitinivorans]|uniref:VOC family protein n=1 Tax=Streptomyces chitinivorans TaxID=1257027 RepID=A0ABW7HYM1_9ACTN|nr:VOC family protein [Streptomyces chitinivorans]MDH2410294.1 VOC family protein [Streptomyces chitinivorans]
MVAVEGAFAEGTPCWTDAMLPDLEAGKRFYGELFGWTFGDPPAAEQPDRPGQPGRSDRPGQGSRTVALLGGRRVASLVRKPDGRLPTVWTVYFATPDAAATARRIRAAGGQLVTEPEAVGPEGVAATAVDPGGAVFGLWQPEALAGFEAVREPGSYVWTEVCTREREPVDAFYREVFGYVMYPAGDESTGEAADIMVWAPRGEPADDEHAVGSRTMIDETYPVEMPAHFLVHFAVADCDAAVRTTVRLGGRTVDGPQDTPFGRYAVLADNQGARFGVLDTSTAL